MMILKLKMYNKKVSCTSATDWKEESMNEAIITAVVTLVVCLINNYVMHNKTITLIDYKLSELTKRVDKHNNVIERTFKLEELTALQEEKIKVANHRIEDLEKKG